MPKDLIQELRDHYAGLKAASDAGNRDAIRARCLKALEDVEAQVLGSSASYASELSRNREERLTILSRLEALQRCWAPLHALEMSARSQARSSLRLDLSVGLVGFGVAVGLVAVGRLKLSFFALLAILIAGQRLGRTRTFDDAVRTALAALAEAEVEQDLSAVLEPVHAWRSTYLWLVSGNRARAVAASLPELRAKLDEQVARATGRVEESLASSIRLLQMFGPTGER
jgi:hypothetical protein